ncbi:MAG: hypothetical protein FWD87_08395 [Spirochaetaceae bacterium]|nr:hypothetical protein [Spirochaetaceae bacterium]
MEKEEKDILKHISKTLDEILLVLKTPADKLAKGMKTFSVFVGALGIFGVIDIILKWIRGG